MGKNRPADDRRVPAGALTFLMLMVGTLVVLWTQVQWLKPGIPFTHDGELHLTRMAQYYLTIKERQLPPRFAGQLNNSFGYPVFDFNYPLPNLLAYPLIVANLPTITAYKLLSLAALILGFTGMWAFLNRRTDCLAGLLGAWFYTLNPYVMSLLYVRGSVGELWAFALFPWLFYFTDKLLKDDHGRYLNTFGFCLTGGLFILSHNIMVLIAIPLLLLFVILSGKHNRKQTVSRLMVPIIIILCLGAFFWIPALAEKRFTILDQVSITQGYQDHFLVLSQLFSGAWGYGFSYSGPVDGLSFFLGLAQVIVVAVALIAAIKLRKREIGLWLVGLAVILGLALSVSGVIWRIIPVLHYIQFPWRWLFLAQFIIAILAAMTFRITRQWRVFWVGVMLLLLIQARSIAQPTGRVSKTDQDLFYATETTSTLDENMSVWFDKPVDYQLKDTLFKDKAVVSEQPTTILAVSKWTGSHHVYTVTATTADRIIERAAYFPGWEVRVDGQKVPVDYQLPTYPGLITYGLMPGTHQIDTRFTQNTSPRIIGNGLTVMGILFLLIYPLTIWLNEKKRHEV